MASPSPSPSSPDTSPGGWETESAHADEPVSAAAPVDEAFGEVRLPLRPVLFPNAYVWFVFVSGMDVMLTWAVLRSGGTEVNPVARAVIEGWGLPGAVMFKFTLAIFVILICEVVGRSRERLGRNLACFAVGISSVPVVYSLALLVDHVLLSSGEYVGVG